MADAFLARYVTLVVFCGGRATRLQHLLNGKPKALVQLHGEPYLVRLLHYARSHDIRQCVLCISPSSGEIAAAVGDGSWFGLSVDYSIDTGLVENAGALWQALSQVRTSVMLCINGDTIVDIDFQDLVDHHVASGCIGTVVTSSRTDQPHPGAVEVGLDSRVRAIREDEQDRGIAIRQEAGFRYCSNSGVYVFDRARLENDWPLRLRIGKLEQGLLQHLASKTQLMAYDNDVRFLLDIGVLDRFQKAISLAKEISRFFPLGGRKRGRS
jgi:NDP-sugar pyrophosphorylase family protein